MINCIIGSILGTLIGLFGGWFFVEWRFRKNLKKIDKLIEDANTFKSYLKSICVFIFFKYPPETSDKGPEDVSAIVAPT